MSNNEQPQPSTSNASSRFIRTHPTNNGSSSTSSTRGQRKEECEPLEKLVIAKKSNGIHEQVVAIRIRAGTASYSEWMSEVQVYLLPNFRHNNILPVAVSETNKCNTLVRKGIKPLKNFDNCHPGAQRLKLEYWITLRYDVANRTLREYLMTNVINWLELLRISRGIMKGIYYLHENHEFQNFDVDESTRLFVKSTNGWLKRVIFRDSERSQRTLHAFPPMHLSVIHRNLSSQNIILKHDLTPCIWNFGTAHIQYPFQPVQRQQRSSTLLKRRQLISPYSAPEVLMQMMPSTLAAYKAIDLYACGIILWELLSRCDLPQLDKINNPKEQLDRTASSRPYQEPYEDQLGPQPTSGKLIYAVCKQRSRPRLKEGWMAGNKSFRFVQTIRELCDHDYEARLHSATVIDRLDQMIMSNDQDFDQRHSCTMDVDDTVDPNVFNTWKLSDNLDLFLTPMPALVEPNICFLSNRDKSVTVPKNKIPEFLMDDNMGLDDPDYGYTSDNSSNQSTLSREQQVLSGGSSTEWIEMEQRARTLKVIDVIEEPEFSIKMDAAPVNGSYRQDLHHRRIFEETTSES